MAPRKTRSSTKNQKKRCLENYFDRIPDEILVHVFGFVSHDDLYRNCALVCKKWLNCSNAPTLWKKIQVSSRIPKYVVIKWVQKSPILEEICLLQRNDFNIIAELLSKHSKELKKIKVVNCNGSSNSIPLQSKALCKLVSYCTKLNTVYFEEVKIRSIKFFELLNERRKLGYCGYRGPVNFNQMGILQRTIRWTEVLTGVYTANVEILKHSDYVDLNNPKRIFNDINNKIDGPLEASSDKITKFGKTLAIYEAFMS